MENLWFAAGIGGIALFYTRLGLFGDSKVYLHKGGQRVGQFNYLLFETAHWRTAKTTSRNDDEMHFMWSIAPICFVEVRDHQ